MICSKCGTELPVGARFCFACGLEQVHASPVETASPGVVLPPPVVAVTDSLPEKEQRERVLKSVFWFGRFLKQADERVRSEMDEIRRGLSEPMEGRREFVDTLDERALS
jgi:hypothetical protein